MAKQKQQPEQTTSGINDLGNTPQQQKELDKIAEAHDKTITVGPDDYEKAEAMEPLKEIMSQMVATAKGGEMNPVSTSVVSAMAALNAAEAEQLLNQLKRLHMVAERAAGIAQECFFARG